MNTPHASTESATALPALPEAPTDNAAPAALATRDWFLRAVLGGSFLLVAGFWTVVGILAAGLLQ